MQMNADTSVTKETYQDGRIKQELMNALAASTICNCNCNDHQAVETAVNRTLITLWCLCVPIFILLWPYGFLNIIPSLYCEFSCDSDSETQGNFGLNFDNNFNN